MLRMIKLKVATSLWFRRSEVKARNLILNLNETNINQYIVV
jgi:hypothetical protein